MRLDLVVVLVQSAPTGLLGWSPDLPVGLDLLVLFLRSIPLVLHAASSGEV
jgi:hypothetical protein